MRNSCDLFVLLGNSRACIYHNKTYVGTLDCHMRSENAVFFYLVVYL